MDAVAHDGGSRTLSGSSLAAWRAFLDACHRSHEARDPEGLRSIEEETGHDFATAVVSLARSSSTDERGTQRKLLLDLGDGLRALFRPESRRLSESVERRVTQEGIEATVAPFWCRRMDGLPRDGEGLRVLYEREIGSPRREVAASLLAERLGSRLVPIARMATWDGERGSVQLVLELAGRGALVRSWDTRRLEAELMEANLLDHLFACHDRVDNWEFTSDGHVLLLDNTQTFGAPGKYHRAQGLTGYRWRRDLIARLRDLASNDLGGLLDAYLELDDIEATRARVRSALAHVDSVSKDLLPTEEFIDG